MKGHSFLFAVLLRIQQRCSFRQKMSLPDFETSLQIGLGLQEHLLVHKKNLHSSVILESFTNKFFKQGALFEMYCGLISSAPAPPTVKQVFQINAHSETALT